MAGEGDILRRDVPYALDRYFSKDRKESVGQQTENGGLVGGIDAVNVQTIIRFGITELLGLLQRSLKVGSILCHLGEDVVGGPIDDAVQSQELVGDQALPEGFKDGDTSRDAGFKIDRGFCFLGQRKQF